MAKYIQEKALDFGFPEESVKLSEYEVLLNEPISIRVGLVHEEEDDDNRLSPSSIVDLTHAFNNDKNAIHVHECISLSFY
jgi:hypothetical protein